MRPDQHGGPRHRFVQILDHIAIAVQQGSHATTQTPAYLLQQLGQLATVPPAAVFSVASAKALRCVLMYLTGPG